MGDVDDFPQSLGGMNVLVSQSPTTPQKEIWRECPPESNQRALASVAQSARAAPS